jgi:hypothetical protein
LKSVCSKLIVISILRQLSEADITTLATDFGRKSKLSTNNKIHVYKATLKPIWTYGIQLWGTVSTSNIEIPERF